MVTVWVLNLDAELELAQPERYAPTLEVRQQVARFAGPARALLEESDVELGETESPGRHAGQPGDCWCPTPRAIARLRSCGALPPPAPPLEVLRRVVERGFLSSLRAADSLGGYGRDPEGVRALLSAAPAGEPWLLKRGFSLAGRGRRRVTAGVLSDADGRWIEAACRLSGVQCEPWREVQVEFALHGRIGPDGELRRGRICLQSCGPAGDWRSTRPVRPGEIVTAEQSALELAFERCARALGEAGFHGPFGLDAYRHSQGFEPLSELNARYSMGWAVGFGRCAQVTARRAGRS